MIRNNHWYNLNEQRSYPVDETASSRSSQGVPLPFGFLADLSLRWSLQYGRYAYISAASATETAVSILISACSTLDNSADDAVLIAGITATRSASRNYVALPLQTFQPYVQGHVVFGDNPGPAFSNQLDSPRASLLTARAARAVPGSLSYFGVTDGQRSTTGLVELQARAPLSIRKSPQVINGKFQENVILFEMVDSIDSTLSTSVFEQYAGACAARVNARNCGDPQPIQTINGVTPDCGGTLTLNFKGCALVSRNTVDCGAVLDCDFSLDQSCAAPFLPDDEGILPTETDPIVVDPPEPPEPPEPPNPPDVPPPVPGLVLPYCDTFDEAAAVGFAPQPGAIFTFINDESPDESLCCAGAVTTVGCGMIDPDTLLPIDPEVSYGTNDLDARTVRSVSLFTLDTQVLYRRFTSDLRVTPNIPGSRQTAGLVLNHKTGANNLPRYYAAVVNAAAARFGIYLFNGTSLAPLIEVSDFDIRTGDWLRITFEADEGSSPTTVAMTATLVGITRTSLNVTLTTTISTASWGTDSGLSGLLVDHSLAYFSYWRIDEL
jgi:hypothetical protein